MKLFEGWRGFDVPQSGYKLDKEGKLVFDQSFVHNLNSQISQVSASGKSLVPMPTPPSVTPPIPQLVITYYITSGQYFGCQDTIQHSSHNSVSSVSINGRP